MEEICKCRSKSARAEQRRLALRSDFCPSQIDSHLPDTRHIAAECARVAARAIVRLKFISRAVSARLDGCGCAAICAWGNAKQLMGGLELDGRNLSVLIAQLAAG